MTTSLRERGNADRCIQSDVDRLRAEIGGSSSDQTASSITAGVLFCQGTRSSEGPPGLWQDTSRQDAQRCRRHSRFGACNGTPDLMPPTSPHQHPGRHAAASGVRLSRRTPIFANIVLADEITRDARTQRRPRSHAGAAGDYSASASADRAFSSSRPEPIEMEGPIRCGSAASIVFLQVERAVPCVPTGRDHARTTGEQQARVARTVDLETVCDRCLD